MARTNPLQFIQQTRAEVAKIIWPTRREVLLTTVMVFIMAALFAAFFSVVDIIMPNLQSASTLRPPKAVPLFELLCLRPSGLIVWHQRPAA